MTQDQVEQDQRLLRVEEAAKFLSVKKNFVYELMTSGDLPFVKPFPSRQSMRRIDIQDLEAWIEKHKKRANP